MTALEQGNRRAEINGQRVAFYRMSGRIRRTKCPIWWVDTESPELLAADWVFRAKLPN